MSVCAFIKASGDRCRAQAMRESQWCYVHNPDLEEERRRNNTKGGKRGGRGRPQAELADIKQRLSDLAENVLEGNVDKGKAAVVSQVLNTYIRAVAVELKAVEQLQIIERLEALEQDLDTKARSRAWG
jgi:hypothetical protein